MKIGLVIESLDPARGGAEQWTFQFASWLLRAGHEVHAVAGRLAPAAVELGLVPHTVPATASRIEFAQSAEQQLDRLNLDVVHDMGCGWQCDVLQPHGGSRLAAFEQNLLLSPSWLRPLKRRGARLLPRYRDFRRLVAAQYLDDRRLFVALSRMVARDLEHFHGVRREQLRLVYNGVDVERFSPDHHDRYRLRMRRMLGVREDEVLVLIVAHNFRLKGVPALLAVIGQLARRRRPVRLAVVGGRHHRGYLHLAHRLGAGQATTFAGPVQDCIPWYAAADLYVHPTLYDPCSLVLLEALASGLPVVTSRFNGAGELLTEGVEGHVVDDPRDIGALADTIDGLLESARRQAMSRAARALALRHSLEHNCRELVAIYEEIAGRRRQAA